MRGLLMCHSVPLHVLVLCGAKTLSQWCAAALCLMCTALLAAAYRCHAHALDGRAAPAACGVPQTVADGTSEAAA
jgi:hypothetical protein